MTVPDGLLPLSPCPHCGALLYVHPDTRPGDRARCGSCREAVLSGHGTLLAPAGPWGLGSLNEGDDLVLRSAMF